MRKNLLAVTTALITAASLLVASPQRAEAGCGCAKAPPSPADIRPHATYRGGEVRIFHPDLQMGSQYTVRFSGIVHDPEQVGGVLPAMARDLADGVEKPQLVVALPDLPLGPVSVEVYRKKTLVVSIPDTELTAIPAPIALPSTRGSYSTPEYRAAVSRDGIVYLALDVSAIQDPLVVEAQALGYPLRFVDSGAMFYNTQGFLMQPLDAAIPGLFSIAESSGVASDVLRYSRHEFNTYFLQHEERQTHAVSDDPNWHVDGSPHIDHNLLILALMGSLPDGSAPVAGSTPAFDLEINAYSVFHQGLTATGDVALADKAKITSFDSTADEDIETHHADIVVQGLVSLGAETQVHGNVTASDFLIYEGAAIEGQTFQSDAPVDPMPVDIPENLTDLGALSLTGGTMTLTGPASFHADSILLDGDAELHIDNAAGPVTLYVEGDVLLLEKSEIMADDPNPEKFALYVVGSHQVVIDTKADLFGVVHAPDSDMAIAAKGKLYGAFVARDLVMTETAKVKYDEALRGGMLPETSGTPDDSNGNGNGKGKGKKKSKKK